jgi:hypothetical protein
LYEASFSNTPEIAYLTEAVSHVSDVQAQNSFLLRSLINENKIKVCKDFEEEEGRINNDLLSRLIIVGGATHSARTRDAGPACSTGVI